MTKLFVQNGDGQGSPEKFAAFPAFFCSVATEKVCGKERIFLILIKIYFTFLISKMTPILLYCVIFSSSLSVCCCRLKPGFEAVFGNQKHNTQEYNSHRICVIPRRTLLGSFIPNPLTASRRKKYSERRILG